MFLGSCTKLRICFKRYRTEWANLNLWNGCVIRKASKVAADLINCCENKRKEIENGHIPL